MNKSSRQDKIDEFKREHSCYIDVIEQIFSLQTSETKELENILIAIRSVLIEKYHETPDTVAYIIIKAINTSRKHYDQYLEILKHLFKEYHSFFDNMFHHKNVYLREELALMEFFENKQNFQVEIQETIISNDNIDSLKEFTIAHQLPKINCFNVMNIDVNYLDLCAYYGSVNCFMFLKDNFEFGITNKTLQLSFIGKNIDIINTCINSCHKDELNNVMNFIVASHNFDFIKKAIEIYNLKIPISASYEYFNYRSLLYLLEMNDENQCDMIFSTIKNKNNLFLKLLMEIGYDPNLTMINYGHSLLYYAVLSKNIESVKILFDYGAIYPQNEELIFDTVNKDMIEITELLLKNGADPNSLNVMQETPLLDYTKSNHENTKMIELLLKYNVDINAKSLNGKTALHNAAYNCNKDICKLLAEKCMNLNCQDIILGNTPLHYAAISQFPENIEVLVTHGANLNIQNREGLKPIELAIRANNKEAAKILIRNGA